MALTGPEKAMYNFLIKREAAGNLNATQQKQLDALKAKVGPASPASPQPLKGKVVTAPPPPDAAKQAAAAKAAAAKQAADAQKARAEKAKEMKQELWKHIENEMERYKGKFSEYENVEAMDKYEHVYWDGDGR